MTNNAEHRKNLFGALDLNEDAGVDQVKIAWRRLASLHHPDKGGNADSFDKLRKTYDEVLLLAAANDERKTMCSVCGGSGRIDNPRHRGFYTGFQIMCPNCKGSGAR